MEIKQSTEPDLLFKNHFIEFCERSKPMDFCQIPSRRLRREKIKQYLNEWCKNAKIYQAHINKKFLVGGIFTESTDRVELEFGFGNFNNFYHNKIAEGWHLVLLEVFKDSGKELITSPLRRKYKSKSLLKWFQKYDKMCKTKKVNGQLIATWNKNDWSN